MARQKKNIVMRNTRGMIGKQIVFKNRNGTRYVAAPPNTDENRKPTKNQLARQDKFRNATQYANEAILDPDATQVDYADPSLRGASRHSVQDDSESVDGAEGAAAYVAISPTALILRFAPLTASLRSRMTDRTYSLLTTDYSLPLTHSFLKLFTGFASAALMDS